MEIKEIIEKLINRIDLTEDETFEIFNKIFLGRLTNVQIAAILTGLKAKGETVLEIAGAAKAMRGNAVSAIIPEDAAFNLVDTCGTGGDYKNTFNISTCAAIISAGAGVKIAKHGNYAVSSKSGSADVLQELGVNIHADLDIILKSIDEANIGFLFAPKFHGAMKFAAPVRTELGIKTIFNVLGPLTNPFNAKNQVMGVYSEEIGKKIAGAVRLLGIQRVFIVYGKDGIDEVSLSDKTIIYEIDNEKDIFYEFNPEDLGFKLCDIKELQAFSAAENAAIIKDIISGEKSPKSEIAILNAGFAIKASGKTNELEEAIYLARESVESGMAKKTLEKFIEISNRKI
ncbi:MAG: anthranilate phosphoribosyltransferase [Deltaproteobacteria bacterium]|nr:anthranilate phosphoribosyltransferase [Deltaproteobacteria bacterium]